MPGVSWAWRHGWEKKVSVSRALPSVSVTSVRVLRPPGPNRLLTASTTRAMTVAYCPTCNDARSVISPSDT